MVCCSLIVYMTYPKPYMIHSLATICNFMLSWVLPSYEFAWEGTCHLPVFHPLRTHFLLASNMFGKSITHSGGRLPLSAEQKSIKPAQNLHCVPIISEVMSKTPRNAPSISKKERMDELSSQKKRERRERYIHNYKGEKGVQKDQRFPCVSPSSPSPLKVINSKERNLMSINSGEPFFGSTTKVTKVCNHYPSYKLHISALA